jgi:hypothetical protein
MSEFRQTLRLVIAIAKGIIRDQSVRRSLLFCMIFFDMLWVFGGAVLYDQWLAAKPVRFLIYWAVCGAITFFCMLLAIHDMLMVRAEARQEKRRIKAEVFGISDFPKTNPRDPQ